MAAGTKLLVGIDEAGYGPNLGPLVVTAVGLQVPETTPSTSLWDCLGPSISRHPADDPEQLVIDDSKRVYSAADGLERLERSSLALLGLTGRAPASLREFWEHCCLTPASDMDEAPWYAERDVALPHLLTSLQLGVDRRNLSAALRRAGCGAVHIACQIILPRRFNEMVARTRSKADVLFQVNAQLLRHIWRSSDTAHIEVFLDKHGGRSFYHPLLQQEFDETIVWAGREGFLSSHYWLVTGGRRLDATFVPRADSEHMLVAAASMIAKYLRELWMGLFNSFWIDRIPGLEPTAGYPRDAQRFRAAILPFSAGIASEILWRDR